MSEVSANIFCLTQSLEDCEQIIKNLDYIQTRDIKKDFFALRNTMPNMPPVDSKTMNLIEPIFNIYKDAKLQAVYTGKSLLITCEIWGWGDAYHNASAISQKLSTCCISIDHKEYGGFLIHLFSDGEVITRYISGKGLDDYGYEESAIDFNLYTQITGDQSIDLKNAFLRNEKDQIIFAISDFVGIDCIISFDELNELLISQNHIESSSRYNLYSLG